MTVIAVGCVFGLPAFMANEFRLVSEVASFVVILFLGILVTLLAGVDLVMRLRRRLHDLR